MNRAADGVSKWSVPHTPDMVRRRYGGDMAAPPHAGLGRQRACQAPALPPLFAAGPPRDTRSAPPPDRAEPGGGGGAPVDVDGGAVGGGASRQAAPV